MITENFLGISSEVGKFGGYQSPQALKASFWAVLVGVAFGALAARGADDRMIRLCNKDTESIYFSVAYRPESNQEMTARGWWQVAAASCIELGLPLIDDDLLIHAESISGLRQWLSTDTAENKLCVDTANKFDFLNAALMPCDASGTETRSFRKLNLALLTTNEPAALPVFEFLPAEATVTGDPIRVCNDSDDEVYLTYAQATSSTANIGTRGWFKVAPKTCFLTKRDPLASDLFLYAESSMSSKSWQGDIPLCTQEFDAFNFTNAESMDCLLNNQRVQLFKKFALQAGATEIRLRPEEAHVTRSTIDLCNNLTKTAYVALSWDNEDIAGQSLAFGWYRIEPNACIYEIPVNSDYLHVRADAEDRSVLVSGTHEVCVDNAAGFLFSKASRMPCTSENQVVMGFASKMIPAGKSTVYLP